MLERQVLEYEGKVRSARPQEVEVGACSKTPVPNSGLVVRVPSTPTFFRCASTNRDSKRPRYSAEKRACAGSSS
jgi:hypothetical protein